MVMRKRDELLKKGTRERPFYYLEIETRRPFRGVMEIVPYLFIGEDKLGPRLVLKDMWPCLSGGLDMVLPVVFDHREKHGVILETSRSSLIELAYQTEERYNIYDNDREMQINAVLTLGFCDPKMIAQKSDKLITAVKFFAIEVCAPKKLSQKDWEVLKEWQIIK